jgi:magnesium transporter
MPSTNAPSAEDIHQLVAQKKWSGLKPALAALEPAEVAMLLGSIAPAERILVYRALPPALAADTFAFLPESDQNALLKKLTDQETRTLLAELSPDDRTELFEEMPAPAVQRLLGLLNPEDRRESLQLLGYPAGSVGRLMTPDFASVRPEMTLAEALEAVRKQAPESETLNMVYVVDERGKLLDELRLRHLVTHAPTKTVRELMNNEFNALSATAPEEAAVRLMKKTGYSALPVVDSTGVLLGLVTSDDVLDVAVEAATEDIQKGGAVQPLDDSLMRTPVAKLYARRIVWLVLLVFVGIFSGAGIAHYEELIESVVALVFFLPLLIGSGGNAGSQAATLVIRSMALGEVELRDYVRVLWKELSVGIGLGLTMAAAVFLLAWVRSGIQIGVVVATAMVSIVLLGSLIGISLPFVLRRLKLDPATASGPLVASMADILGVVLYLSIASLLLDVVAR